jgi:hypothetical protein
MPDRIEELLHRFPDGICTACLARRRGQSQGDLEAIVAGFLVHLSLRVHAGICPECGAIGRIVRAL